MKNTSLIISVVVVVLIIFLGGYFLYQKLPSKVQAPVTDQTVGWKTYLDDVNGVQLKYPETFSGATWQVQDWPPTVVVSDISSNVVMGCGQDISSGIEISGPEDVMLNNMNFKLYRGGDVGAGQLYTDYCYALDANNKHYTINFLIHSTNGCGDGNCGPYCGTENEQACKNFDMQKEVVQPMENMVSTLKFIK
jgi:hypothetical protein